MLIREHRLKTDPLANSRTNKIGNLVMVIFLLV